MGDHSELCVSSGSIRDWKRDERVIDVNDERQHHLECAMGRLELGVIVVGVDAKL